MPICGILHGVVLHEVDVCGRVSSADVSSECSLLCCLLSSHVINGIVFVSLVCVLFWFVMWFECLCCLLVLLLALLHSFWAWSLHLSSCVRVCVGDAGH